MTDIETLLADHLRRRADAVDVRDDLEGVLAELATPEPHDGHRRQRGAVVLAAAAIVAVGIGAVALVAGRDDAAERPAAPANTAPSPATAPPATAPPTIAPPTIVPPMTTLAPDAAFTVGELVVAQGASEPAGCDVLADQLVSVATAVDPYGGPDYEWWVAPTSGGGRSEIVAQVDRDGQMISGGGGSLRCDPAPVVDIEWTGGGGRSGAAPMVTHGGHVSVDATAVVITFLGQAPLQVPLNPDGYFLTVLAEDPSGPYSHPDRIDALDSEGTIVATVTL